MFSVERHNFSFLRPRDLYSSIPLLRLLVNIATTFSSQFGARVEGRFLHTEIHIHEVFGPLLLVFNFLDSLVTASQPFLRGAEQVFTS